MTSTLVRDHLIAAGIVSSTVTTGWACLIGGLSDNALVSTNQVAILDRAGLPPIANHGGVGLTQPGIQILVRGEPGIGGFDSYTPTAAKAQAIWDALHRQRITGLQIVEGVNNPIWVHFDEKNRPVWSLNFTAIQN